MANNVTVVAFGGQPQIKSASSVQELIAQLNLGQNVSVTINGDTASLSATLSDYDFVSFGEKVKGGAKTKRKSGKPATKLANTPAKKPTVKLRKKAK